MRPDFDGVAGLVWRRIAKADCAHRAKAKNVAKRNIRAHANCDFLKEDFTERMASLPDVGTRGVTLTSAAKPLDACIVGDIQGIFWFYSVILAAEARGSYHPDRRKPKVSMAYPEVHGAKLWRTACLLSCWGRNPS